MKKTNRTYQVYVANPKYCNVLSRGTKRDMEKLFNMVKEDPEYDCVILAKYNERHNCWDTVEKHMMYN
jgi:hypothetical protein